MHILNMISIGRVGASAFYPQISAITTTRRNNRTTGNSRTNHSSTFVTTVVNRLSSPDGAVKSRNDTGLNIRFEPMYRIVLHYSRWKEDDTRMVAQKVKFGVPIITMRDCERVVKQAFSHGRCIVCTVTQEKATLYCNNLVRVGLNASMEEA